MNDELKKQLILHNSEFRTRRSRTAQGDSATRNAIQIPASWKEKRASSLFQIQGGFAFKSTDSTSNGVRWLKIANVGLGNVKWDEKSYLPEGFLQLHENFCLNNGDIVVAMTRPLLSGVLKIAQLSDDDSPCLLNQRVGRLLPKEDVSKDFLFHVLKTRHLAYKLESDLLGTDPPNLSIKTFKNIKISLPPLPEQKAIADLLSTWDEAIEKTERLIQAKEKRFKWLLRELISEPRNTQKDAKWKKVKLGKYILERNEKSNIHDQYPVLTSSRKGLFYQSDYFSKQVTSSNNEGYKIIENGDFTYRAMSDDGRFAFNRLDFCSHGIISPAYGVFYPKNINSDFLLFYMNSSAFFRELLKESQGGTRISLKLNAMKNMMVSIPSIELQNQIAETLSSAQQEIDLLKQLAEKYKTQKRGLMQKMLTGEWRVKPEIVNQYMEDA